MSLIEVTVDLRHVASHSEIIDQISPAFEAQPGDRVNIELNINRHFLFADYLLLIASSVNYLKGIGVIVHNRFLGLHAESAGYASRVNFFDLIGYEYNEDFIRRNPEGRFTEITPFTEENALELFHGIMNILARNGTNQNMLTVLDYCLWEVIDNTLNHSTGDFVIGSGNGFISAQYFPGIDEVRIMIADNGVGIHQALTTHPDSTYQHLTEREAVLRCIERGVTNSLGKGFGLWATSEMVKENNGELIIHSGSHKLSFSGNDTIQEMNRWRGTMTFLRINTDTPVDYRVIFGEDPAYANDFLERRERLFGNIDDLW